MSSVTIPIDNASEERFHVDVLSVLTGEHCADCGEQAVGVLTAPGIEAQPCCETHRPAWSESTVNAPTPAPEFADWRQITLGSYVRMLREMRHIDAAFQAALKKGTDG